MDHDWDDSCGGGEQYCSVCGIKRSEYEQHAQEQREEDESRDA